MKSDLLPGETVLRESRANMQRGPEQVGGHLILTDQRLIFEAHRLNVQHGADAFDRDEIASVANAWTRFLGLIPLAPNSIAVTLSDGRTVRFVVSRRKKWREALSPASA